MNRFASFASASCLLALTALLAPACSTSTEEKEPVAEQSQGISLGQMKIVGSLVYGQTSGSTAYRSQPRYRAYKFAGNAGDKVDVWVKSPNGDPVTWILDNDFKILALNDDASPADTNSHVKVTLPANASATHYVVVRDYWLSNMSFRVSLAGVTTDFASGCNVDADCVRVDKGCCALGDYAAVLGSKADAYQESLGCTETTVCPLILAVDDHSVAQCNSQSHTCEVVKPKDIECNAFSMNPHACPDGYHCRLPDFIADAPGKCVQFCGGFGNFQCSDPTEQCIDDPTDTCDPTNGGADCGGICTAPTADCRTTGCGTGSMCSPCWGAWSCIPQGARC